MKKSWRMKTFLSGRWRKTLLIMKLTCLFMLLSVCQLTASVSAQNVRMDVDFEDASLSEVFREVRKLSGFNFLYNAEEINSKKNLSIEMKNATLEEVLDECIKGRDLKYKIQDSTIVLSTESKVILQESKAQEKQIINGSVTDKDGIPLPGVSVVVKGTTTGVTTNIEGSFTLTVLGANQILIFSFVGMESQEIKLTGNTIVNVVLEDATIGIGEIVAIGYGVQKKEDATGAVDVVKSESFNQGMNSSPTELLSGKTAGVQITQNSGAPGGGSSVRIRGINSITGSSEPLYVIDGVPIDNSRKSVSTSQSDNATSSVTVDPLSSISSADIESITVLKDASATAIYGSRGANGVIIITTKKGKQGAVSISYSGSVGVSTLSKKIDLLSADEYISAVNNLASQVQPGTVTDPHNYNGYSGAGASTDWQDEVYRNAITQKHDLSFSGGVQQFNYRFSAGYYSQEGIVDNTDYERLTTRFNASQSMFEDKLKMDVNMSITDYESNNLPEQQTGGYLGGVLNNILKMDPTQPVYSKDGSYNEYAQDVRNPLALLNQTEDVSEGFRFIGSIQTTYKFTDNLFVKINLAKDYETGKRKIYQEKASSITSSGRAIRENLDSGSDLVEVYLNYKAKLGENKFSALAGHSYQEFYSDIVGVVGTGFATDELGYNNLSADKVEATAFKENNKLASFFVRANFDFNNRFLLTGTLRADGSSKFDKGNRWGYFPSGAIAWKLSNEEFLSSSDVISSLKLRLGIGRTGNQDIGNNLYLSNLSLGGNSGSYFGDSYYAPIIPTNISNPNLKWEKTTQTNVGLDFGFWKGRLSGSFDYYNKKTSNLLVEIPAVQPAVASTYLDNIGEMVNKGIELSASYFAMSKKDLSLDLGFNISFNDNEITELYSNAEIYTGIISGAGAPGTGIQQIKEGQAYGTFYGYSYLGTNQAGKETFRKADGTATIDINEAQLGVIGEALPTINYGFNASLKYKNWDASISLRGVSGNEIYNNTRAEIVQPDRIPGTNTTSEAIKYANSNANEYRSSRWLEDGSFLRLDNMTVGYNLKNIGKLKNLRLFVTGQNLFVITNYKGYDPEVNTTAGTSAAKSIGIDYTNYPKARTILGGVTVNF